MFRAFIASVLSLEDQILRNKKGDGSKGLGLIVTVFSPLVVKSFRTVDQMRFSVSFPRVEVMRGSLPYVLKVYWIAVGCSRLVKPLHLTITYRKSLTFEVRRDSISECEYDE